MLMTEAPARVSNAQFARFAWFVLAFNLAVILWGAVVRATGSGAGCGNHWPLCGGQLSPAFATLATVIEFAHRATSGILTMLVVAMLVWAFRAFPSGHPARLGAVLSTVFLVTEAIIGAALVLLDRVGRNQSAPWLSTHLVNTLTLAACLALTAWWGMGKPAVRPSLRMLATLGAVMLLSVSGAIAALADTLYPATSLSAALAQDFAPGAHLFVRLRGLHPVMAAGVAVWLFVFAAEGLRAHRRLALLVIGFTAAQLMAGLLNMLLLAPLWLQITHLLIADGLWVALVLLGAAGKAGVGVGIGDGV
jgi:heme A synthase